MVAERRPIGGAGFGSGGTAGGGRQTPGLI